MLQSAARWRFGTDGHLNLSLLLLGASPGQLRYHCLIETARGEVHGAGDVVNSRGGGEREGLIQLLVVTDCGEDTCSRCSTAEKGFEICLLFSIENSLVSVLQSSER